MKLIRLCSLLTHYKPDILLLILLSTIFVLNIFKLLMIDSYHVKNT